MRFGLEIWAGLQSYESSSIEGADGRRIRLAAEAHSCSAGGAGSRVSAATCGALGVICRPSGAVDSTGAEPYIPVGIFELD